MTMSPSFISLAVAAAVGLSTVSSGCAQESDAVEDFCEPVVRHYAITTLQVPVEPEDYMRTAIDLDDDGGADNSLGFTMQTIRSQFGSAAGWQDTITAALADSEFSWVLSVESCADGSDGPATTSLSRARRNANGSVTFDGEERFAAASGTKVGNYVSSLGGSTIAPVTTLADILGGYQPTWMRADAFAASVQVFDNSVGGTIAMAFREQLITVIADPLVDFLNERLAAGTSVAAQIIDQNEDGVITRQEFIDSSFVRSLLYLDVDLYDESGALDPLGDGIRDAISFGIEFDAEPVGVAQTSAR